MLDLLKLLTTKINGLGVRDGFGWTTGNIATLPVCDVTRRGEERRVTGAAGVADQKVICQKDAANVYSWMNTATAGGFFSGTITVQEGDANVDTAVATLDFDASDFNITSSPAGEANVALNYGTAADQPLNSTAGDARYQPLDSDLTTIAGLTATSNNFMIANASAWASRTPTQALVHLGLDADLPTFSVPASTTISAFGATLVDDASATVAIATLGLDADIATLSLPASTTISAFGASLIDDASATVAIATLGLDADIATLSLPASTTITTFGASLIDDANAAAAIATLTLDADLATFSVPASTTISAFGKTLVDDADAATAIATLGLDADLATLSLPASVTITAAAATVLDDTTTGAMLTTLGAQPVDADLTTIAGLTATTDNMIQSVSSAWASRTPTQVKTALGLVIGTNVQAWDADLDTISGLSATTNNFMVANASAWASRTPTQAIAHLGLDADIATLVLPASTTISTFGATLTDDADAATARATLAAAPTASPTFSGTITLSDANPLIDIKETDGPSGEQGWRTELFAGDMYLKTLNDAGAGTTTYANFTRTSTTVSQITWNTDSLDTDFQIKGDTDANLFYLDASADSIGIGTASPTSWFDLKPGTTARAPIRFPSGTNVTTPLAGTEEFDGTGFYETTHATEGRMRSGATSVFYLTGNGSTISTIANFFGSTSAFATTTNGVYEFTYHCYFLNTTAGTLVWTITNTQTWTNVVGSWEGSPVGGVTAVGGIVGAGSGVATTTAGFALPTTGTLTDATRHYHRIRVFGECGTAGNVRLNATKAVGGTITPLRGSYYTVRRVSGNTGAFVA